MRKKASGASKDSIFLAFVKIVGTLAAIAETKIISIGFSLKEVGTSASVNVVQAICTSILLMGLGDAINFFYNSQSDSRSKEERIKYIDTVFAIELILGCIIACTLFLGRHAIADYYSNPAIIPLLMISLFKPMLNNILTFYQLLYISVGRAKLIAIRNLLLTVIGIAVTAISALVINNLVVLYATSLFVTICQLLFLAWYFQKREFRINPFSAKKELVKEILRYAWPMGVYALTRTVSREVDRLVIGYFANTEEIAVYANCSKILPFDVISVSFATVLIPFIMNYVSGGEKKQAVHLFRNYLKIGYYSVFVFGIGSLIVTNQIIPFLYSDEYLSGKSVFIIYIIDSMLGFASMHLILAASGQTKRIMRYSIISLGVNIFLNVILYKAIGMVGPAISTMIVTFGYTLAILNKSRLILEAEWNVIFDLPDLVRFGIILVGTGIVSYYFNKVMSGFNIHRFICMLATLIIFGSLNLLLNFKNIREVLGEINKYKHMEN